MSRVTSPAAASIRNTGARPSSSAASTSARAVGRPLDEPAGQWSQSPVRSRTDPSATDTTASRTSPGSCGVERFSRTTTSGLPVRAEPRAAVLEVLVVEQHRPLAGRDVDQRQRRTQAAALGDAPRGGDRRAVRADVVLQRSRARPASGVRSVSSTRGSSVVAVARPASRRRAAEQRDRGPRPRSAPARSRAGSPRPSSPCAPCASPSRDLVGRRARERLRRQHDGAGVGGDADAVHAARARAPRRGPRRRPQAAATAGRPRRRPPPWTSGSGRAEVNSSEPSGRNAAPLSPLALRVSRRAGRSPVGSTSHSAVTYLVRLGFSVCTAVTSRVPSGESARPEPRGRSTYASRSWKGVGPESGSRCRVSHPLLTITPVTRCLRQRSRPSRPARGRRRGSRRRR